MPNLRYTARGLPQIRHRDSIRDEYFGVLFAFAIFDLLATSTFVLSISSVARLNIPTEPTAIA